MRLRISIYQGNADMCSVVVAQYSTLIENGRENRTLIVCLPFAYSGLISPCCQAKTAACVRSTMCNLPRMLLTWPLTVFSLSTNCSAMRVLKLPSASSRRTSSSRSVSLAKAGYAAPGLADLLDDTYRYTWMQNRLPLRRFAHELGQLRRTDGFQRVGDCARA
jgi:hypothetical protein